MIHNDDLSFLPDLPIREALPDLLRAVHDGNRAVLIAPPGAGKTTCVPLALLGACWCDGRIVMLEPRRLAAKAAARYMASLLGEKVGQRVGYRVRMESRISKETVIEVVTEGVFARMLVDDPSLDGIAAVLFDEFHERSLDADMSLAFALDAQEALREDLRIVVMSATIDGGRVAEILDTAPVIQSMGRAFPVETRYLPRSSHGRLDDAVVTAILKAIEEEKGSILVFLPGQAEIHRIEGKLSKRIGKGIFLAPLYGALDGRDQDQAISPPKKDLRKIVLATSIAETSLTIDGVRIIIDAGLARRPRFEASLGLSRLETVKVSRASADQRQGRAGRTEPGVCYRLWDKGQMAALPAFDPPEILATDLSRLVLDLALWGESNPANLKWLDEPPRTGWQEAVKLLQKLEALDEMGRLTDHGRAIARLPLPPRLAHMLVRARGEGAEQEALAAYMAALLSEGGRLRHNDLRRLLQDLTAGRLPRSKDIKALASRWMSLRHKGAFLIEEAGRILALAYPDRIAMRRGAEGRYLLASGRGGVLDAEDPLNSSTFLVVADLQGSAAHARISLAAPITRKEIEQHFAQLIGEEEAISFDKQSGAVSAKLQQKMGRIVLAEKRLASPSPEAIERALIDAVRKQGLRMLPFSRDLERWRGRIRFVAEREEGWPDLSDEALLSSLENWLQPYLAGKTGLGDISENDLKGALQSLVSYEKLMSLDANLPTHFIVPTGSRIPIDYGAENGPVLAVRVQELFGLDMHPSIGGGQIPLLLHLLSPARRPIQMTRDLPGFWRGSWRDVKADMRGQYPKHVWPDDPLATEATRRTKARSKT